MLKFLRKKKVMKRIFWGIAIIIIPAFTLWGVGSAVKQKEKGPTYAGKIFNKIVSFRDYEAAYRATELQAKLIYGDKFDEISKFLNLGNETWNRILILRECNKNKIQVSDKELSERIASFPFFQKDGRFDLEAYQRVLKYFLRCEPRFFEDTMRDSMRISKFIEKKIGQVSISDEELKKLYKEEKESAKISFILYNSKDFADNLTIPEGEILAYYGQNSEEFRLPDEVSIEYVQFKFKDFEKGVNLTDSDIRNYYDSNKKEFEKPEEIRARHILVKTEPEAKEILDILKLNKEPFEKIAKERSLDPGSKPNGGDLGYFTKGRMVKEFEDAAFKLKPGELSDIVKTNYGFHIIKLEDKKEPYVEEFDKVKDSIKNNLLLSNAKDIAMEKARAISDKLRETPADFEKITASEKLETKLSGPFTKEGAIPSIGFSPQIQEIAFGMNPGEISDVIYDQNNPSSQACFIIKLKEKIPTHIEPLANVKDKIKNILISKKSAERAIKKADDDYKLIRGMLDSGVSFEEAAETMELGIKKSDDFTRGGFIKEIGPASEIEAVFLLKTGEVSKPIVIKQGVCIARLDGITGIDEKKFKEESEEFKNKELQTKKNKSYDDFIKDLYNRSSIKMNIKSIEELYK